MRSALIERTIKKTEKERERERAFSGNKKSRKGIIADKNVKVD